MLKKILTLGGLLALIAVIVIIKVLQIKTLIAAPKPNPQSPIPNPQSPKLLLKLEAVLIFLSLMLWVNWVFSFFLLLNNPEVLVLCPPIEIFCDLFSGIISFSPFFFLSFHC